MTPPRGRLDTMSHGELAVALRWWSDGDPPTEAAVELLIAHGVWLHRPDFHTAALRPVPDDASAAALAGHGTTPLRALLAPLSRQAAAHVVRAVAHAASLGYYRAATTPPLSPAVLRPSVPRPGRPASSGRRRRRRHRDTGAAPVLGPSDTRAPRTDRTLSAPTAEHPFH